MTIGPEPTMRMEWRSSRRGMKGARGGWNETAAPGLAGIRPFGASRRNATGEDGEGPRGAPAPVPGHDVQDEDGQHHPAPGPPQRDPRRGPAGRDGGDPGPEDADRAAGARR